MIIKSAGLRRIVSLFRKQSYHALSR